MAEINQSNTGHKNRTGRSTTSLGVKSKKQSTKVDLTPMVDLGFLLITFFIFATTLAMPSVAKFRMPKDDVDPINCMKALGKAAITVLISPNKKQVYYYTDTAPDDKVNGIKMININKLQKAIIAHKQNMAAQNIPDSLILLSLKPLPGAKYGAFMQVFDEVLINDLKNYVKVKTDINEIMVIDKYNTFNKITPIPKTE
jgi:biopolymer transport protein ExbD